MKNPEIMNWEYEAKRWEHKYINAQVVIGYWKRKFEEEQKRTAILNEENKHLFGRLIHG